MKRQSVFKSIKYIAFIVFLSMFIFSSGDVFLKFKKQSTNFMISRRRTEDLILPTFLLCFRNMFIKSQFEKSF